MAKWVEYPEKTTPQDEDDILIGDIETETNKRTKFSGIWSWIAGKLNSAALSNLETNNKTIIGAINELRDQINGN